MKEKLSPITVTLTDSHLYCLARALAFYIVNGKDWQPMNLGEVISQLDIDAIVDEYIEEIAPDDSADEDNDNGEEI